MTLRVAVAQGESVSGDVAANVATAAGLAGQAAERGARLVLLPEAFLTGYDPASFAGDLPQDEGLDDGWLDPLVGVATGGDLTIVVSGALQRADARTLSLLVVRPTGEVIAPYDKQHLFGEEVPHFAAGDHGTLLRIDDWVFGLSVCYDACFPEHARAAADAGAHAYLNSAAYVTGSDHRRDLYAASRALDNGMYVLFSGLTGRCGPESFSGGSGVYDPEGRPVVRMGTEVGVAVTDLDPELVRTTRAAHTMHADHRGHLGPLRTV